MVQKFSLNRRKLTILPKVSIFTLYLFQPLLSARLRGSKYVWYYSMKKSVRGAFVIDLKAFIGFENRKRNGKLGDLFA